MQTLQKDKVTKALVFIAVLALILFGFTYVNNNDAEQIAEKGDPLDNMNQDLPEISGSNPVVTLKTTMGDITLELYTDRTPITAGNFLKLAEQGFYNGTKFHRVIDNFMVQGGDPNSRGDDASVYGQGGPGYTIEDEFDPELSNLRGTISMANIGQPNSGGSQFFINFTNNVGLDFDKQPLTSKHPVFGHVIQGLDVVDAIAKTPTDARDLPLTPVVIEEVIVLRGEGEGEEATEEEVVEEPGEETQTDEEVSQTEENTEEDSGEEEEFTGTPQVQ